MLPLAVARACIMLLLMSSLSGWHLSLVMADDSKGYPTRPVLIVPSVLGGWEATRRNEFNHYNQLLINVNAKLDFVFIGDSITHFWLLHQYFDHIDVTLVNRGIGGDTPANILNRFESDVIQLHPRYVHVWTGINELWNADAKALEAIPETAARIRTIAQRATAAKITPILCSVTPLAEAGLHKPPSRKVEVPTERSVNQAVPVLNQQIREIARELNGIYVDYYSGVLDETGQRLRPEYTDDGVHFNDTGKKQLTKILRHTLSERGIKI